VTHEELRALLPRYAAGVLDETRSEAVRTHLATGCDECLQDVFTRPVGLPVDKERQTANAVAARPRHRRRRRARRVAGVLLGTVAVGAIALAAWAFGALWGREAAQRVETERLRAEAARLADRVTENERALAELRGRADGLAAALTAAREESGRQAEAAREMAEENARLAEQLDEARRRVDELTPALRARQRELDRLRRAADDEHLLRDLLATPGSELWGLRPVAPFRDAHGQVVWHPARREMILYAFGLPPLPAGSTYEVRLGLDDGDRVAGPSFAPSANGTAVVSVPVNAEAQRVREIEVVLEPAAAPVLTGSRRPPPS